MDSKVSGQIGPFVLSYWDESDEGNSFWFPVAPPQINVKYAHEFSEISVLGLGQADLRGGDRLAELSFSSFFPRDFDPTLVDSRYFSDPENFPTPTQFERRIHDIRIDGRPCRLTIGGTYFSAPVMIRSFDVEHRGGEAGDVYFTITFKKHRFLTVRKTEAESASSGGGQSGNGRPAAAPAPKTYTVVSGDTLWGIAKRFLGDGAKWPQIYNLNKGVIGSNPNLIRPGQKFTLPASGGSVDAPSVAGALKGGR